MWAVISVIVFSFTVVEGCVYRHHECAPYTVIEKHGRNMILSFPALTWAIATGTGNSASIAEFEAYKILLRYMMGKNDRRQNLNFTLPFRTRTTTGGEGVIIEMSYMIPKNFADNPPNPIDKNITISKEGPQMYAVRTFPGRKWRRSSLLKEVAILMNSVPDDKTEFYIASFEGPVPTHDVEIWIKMKSTDEGHEIA